MLGNGIYEQMNKIFRNRILDTEDLIRIKTTNIDNDIINGTNVADIVTYYRI